MTRAFKLVALAMVVIGLSGCASMRPAEKRLLCTLVGGLAGGAIGAAATTEDDTEAGIAGGVVGAGIGYMLCGDKKEPVVAAAPAPAPAPTPAPAPAPRDSDGDGVNDASDACPNTPRGTKVDARGCPQVGQTLLRLEGVNFAFDRAEITADSATVLDKAVAVLKDNAAVRVRVEGHTDSRGSDTYNQSLSERRAQAVVDYLAGKGIARSQLQAQGFGESRPLTANDSDANRARNRRVEFVVAQ